MKQFKDHFKSILDFGISRPNRTGDHTAPDSTLSLFGRQLRFDLKEGFPLTTSKELKLEAMAKEITWMLRGETNTNTLGVSIWDKWALKEQLAIKRPMSEGKVIGQLAKIRNIPEDQLNAETFNALSTELFELQRKYVHIVEGTTTTRDNTTVPLTADILIPEDLALSEVTIDSVAFDKELEELGIKTFEIDVQYEAGYCGPIYGEQWRAFKSVIKQNGAHAVISTDQFAAVHQQLRDEPDSRRIIIDGWNPGLVPVKGLSITENIAIGRQGLPPCHVMCQFLTSYSPTSQQRELSALLTMRSSDGALGLGFNVAAYSFITHMYAAEFGFGVGELIVNIGDAHIYKGHIEGIEEYISRPQHTLPTFNLAENYEAFKLKVVKNAIEEYVDQAEYATPEDRQAVLDKHFAKIDMVTPEGRASAFIIFLNNIPSSAITQFMSAYTHEPHIAFDLYD